jgi:alginate O-acetyltransferase complex protein AlgJ
MSWLKSKNMLLGIGFFGLIFSSFAWTFLKPNSVIAQNENRNLAPLPHFPLDVHAISEFPQQFEKYFNDHFGFRARFVRIEKNIIFRLFRTSASEKVVLGKSGWLFYRDEKGIESYRNSDLFSDADLAAWRNFFVTARDRAKSLHTEFYVIIPPNAATIYGEEFMPDWIKKMGPVSRMDQLKALLTHENISFIDPRAKLTEGKDANRVYYQTDTHWNELGAFYGYTEMMNVLASKHPELRPLPLAQFHETIFNRGGGDLAGMLGLSDYLGETSIALTPIISRKSVVTENPGANLIESTCEGCGHLHFMAVRDSFFISMQPFVFEHFGRSTLLRLRNIDWKVVAQEHPDILVYELVERHLMFEAPQNIF